MNTVIPAVIPQSFDDIQDVIDTVGTFAREVQIDIVDGRFVPFTSWPYRGSGSIMLLKDYAQEFTVEIDLMIDHPEEALPLYIDAGVKKVVVHLESTEHLNRIIEHRRSHEYALGLSITNETSLDTLTSVIGHADYVQLMGIRKIGSQGQPFDEEVLARVRFLREQFPELVISIDGSVNASTLPRLKLAGANRFVSGSAIFSAPDPHASYEELTRL